MSERAAGKVCRLLMVVVRLLPPPLPLLRCRLQAAVEAGRRMVAEGADILDVGGQSTHPTSQPLTAQEEAARVVPVIRCERAAAAFGLPKGWEEFMGASCCCAMAPCSCVAGRRHF